ncbi:hypothetical protein GCM10012279_23820 [Micromonospora yangpuensis]|nr:hypothetical protein GCM10012279_23820 [Micromonospora yangpuensis]
MTTVNGDGLPRGTPGHGAARRGKYRNPGGSSQCPGKPSPMPARPPGGQTDITALTDDPHLNVVPRRRPPWYG